ncbi:MAG: Ger(x)C family spore germination protein [Oscillospiraceae bacterium]|jgi:spore germination protein KC|nr:Ger(x)C family spore germination protein [Oscillospiraceae bacterium]
MKKNFTTSVNRIISVILCLSITLLTTGCWDSKEIDTISIVTGIGIDTSQNPDEINLTAQIGKTQPSGGALQQDSAGGDNDSFLVMEATSKGILSAFESMNTKNSRTPFLQHNQVIIFGKEQAEKGVQSYIDVFLRYYQMRMEVWFLVADSKAKDILTVKTQPEKNSAISLSEILRDETNISESLRINLKDFVSRLIEPTSSAIAPIVSVQKGIDTTFLAVDGMAIFKKDKMVGQLTSKQIDGYIWTMGRIKEIPLEISLDPGYGNMQAFNIKCSMKPIIQKDGVISVSLQIRGQMVLDEIKGFDSMNLNEIVPLLQRAANEKVHQDIMNCLSEAQRLNSDIFGFGTAFHRNYPKEWKSLKNKWDQLFPKLKINTDIKLEIINPGKIGASLNMEDKK